MHQFGGGRPRRRPTTAQPPGSEEAPSLSGTISSLIPLLFLFILPLLSSIWSSGSTPQGPSIVFDHPRGSYSEARTSKKFHVNYWVDPREINGYNNRDLRRLDEIAENKYIQTVNVRCETERYQRSRMEQEATGWFYDDEVKMQQARDMPMPNCKKLKDMGIIY